MPCGRPRWVSRRSVPSPSGSSEISTVLAPGATGSAWSSQPQVNTSLRWGTISITSPLTRSWPLMLTAYSPPDTGSSTASVPIQRTILAGSVRNSNTVDGAASIVISRWTTSVSSAACRTARLLGFDLALELLQAIAPEVVEERAQLDQPLGADAVDPASTVTSLAHQPSAVQDAEVLRDRLPRDVEARGDPPGGHLLVVHQSQDLPSSRLDYRLKCCLHATT